jgi:hypothetical protein
MAYTLYEEEVLTDLKDYIADHLNTYLEGIETEQADGLDLPDFKRIDVGEADIFNLNVYPALLLFPEEVNYEYLATRADDLQMSVNAVAVLKGAVTENLARKALRYVAAMRKMLDADRTAGAQVDSVAVKKVRFNARSPGSENFMVVEIILAVGKEINRT